jgi:hypothetical protein
MVAELAEVVLVDCAGDGNGLELVKGWSVGRRADVGAEVGARRSAGAHGGAHDRGVRQAIHQRQHELPDEPASERREILRPNQPHPSAQCSRTLFPSSTTISPNAHVLPAKPPFKIVTDLPLPLCGSSRARRCIRFERFGGVLTRLCRQLALADRDRRSCSGLYAQYGPFGWRFGRCHCEQDAVVGGQ